MFTLLRFYLTFHGFFFIFDRFYSSVGYTISLIRIFFSISALVDFVLFFRGVDGYLLAMVPLGRKLFLLKFSVLARVRIRAQCWPW